MSDYKTIYEDVDVKLLSKTQTDVESTPDAPRTVVLRIGAMQFGFELLNRQLHHVWEKKDA